MTVIVGIAGSLRKESYNARLLAAAAGLMPAGVVLEVASIAGIPLFDADVERDTGLPDAVVALKDRIAASDGLFLVTPEYNGSIPGVFKNAIDWLSRPAADIPRVFGGRPVGLVGATPGRAGTRLSQTGWLSVFRALGLVPYFGHSLYVAGAGSVFSGETIVDDAVQKLLKAYLAGFSSFVERSAATA
jgi:NAD(P)H-dependent FMN reductase